MNKSKGVQSIALTFVRGKKQSSVTPATQRVVNQLSALSASRKQPKLLKLCQEDLIKHKTITNAWKVYQRKVTTKRNEQLDKQLESMSNAMEELKKISPDLYEAANVKPTKFRYPLEYRVPTDYPANDPWVYNYAPSK